jgi:hypothetical protein
MAATASSVMLTTSVNPSILGQQVTLTAVVSPATATGKVTFYDGATTVIGIGTLGNGKATVTTSLLAAGARSLRAYYPGNSMYIASTSAVVGQTVNAQPENGFQSPVNYGVDAFNQVAVGDFNGDGYADLIVAFGLPSIDTTFNGISVLLGNGDGSFRSGSTLRESMPIPSAVAVGDFNGDGKADVVVADMYVEALTEFGGVGVFLGNGDGTFQRPQGTNGYATPGGASGVAVGDFNGDGVVDIVVQSSQGQYLLVGNGDGTFQAPVSFSATVNMAGVMGDFNGDGRLDYATANTSGVSVFLGIATGVATTSTTLTSAANPASFGQTVTPTAMVYPRTATSTVTFYDGATTLGASTVVAGSATLVLSNLGVGSHSLTATYNGDANDTASTSSVLTQTIVTGTPTSIMLTSSANPAVYGQPVTVTASVSPSVANGMVTFFDGATPLGTRTLLNGQAALTTNLLASGTRSLKAIYSGSGAYSPSTSAVLAQSLTPVQANTFLPTVYYGVGTNPESVAVGDFNGDGLPDLAIANKGGNVTVLWGTGSGTFGSARSYAAGGHPISVAAGDLNGDGILDLAVANYDSGTVSVLFGYGDGTFQLPVNYSAGANPYSVAIGDFNGDGKPDLAVANNGGGNVSVLLGNGVGIFQSAVNYGAGTNPTGIVLGDFNADGKQDLAVVNNHDGTVSVLLGNGDGTFRAAVNYAVGSSPFFAAAADFNGDGKVDLVVANYSGNTVSLLAGNGDGTFRAAVNFNAGANPYSVAVGDFNGDGTSDLIVTNNSGVSVSVLLGNGDGTFQAPVSYSEGSNPGAIAVGDFNGDGRTDVVIANFNGSNVGVLLGANATQLKFTTQPTTGLLWAPIPPFVVQVQDPGGNRVPLNLAVTVTSPSSGVTSTVNAVNGIATFTNVIFFAAGSYTLTASAAGVSPVTSTSFSIVDAPPTVAIDSPIAGAVLTPGANTVSGWALDNRTAVGSAISKVQVLLDGALAGNATYGISRPDACNLNQPGCPNVGYTYVLNTAGLSKGTHTITVVATDSDFVADPGSSSVTFTVTNTPPSVHIDAPVSGSVLSGVGTISGWAIDSTTAVGTAISGVQIKVDGNVVGNATYGLPRPDVCTAFPGRIGCPNVGFTYALNTSSLAPGSHVITAAVTDSDANPDTGSTSVSITVTSVPPSVYIDSPAPGAMLSGTATVSGWAIDNSVSVGTAIAGVVIKVDGNVVGNATSGTSRSDVCTAYPSRPGCPNVGFTYALDTTKLTPGAHTLTAVATDSDGTPDSGSWTVAIQVSAAPTVFIDSPVAGASVGGTVTVSGWAIDNATAIGSVQIKVDGTVVGNASYGLARPDVCAVFPGRPGCPNVGFMYPLNTASLSAGMHTITAVAADTDGTPDLGSYTVTVSVTASAPPLVYVDSVAPGAMVSGIVTVSGWAIDSATAIGSVQVKVDAAVVGTATYGLARPDVCAAFPGRPGCPNVGFAYSLNTTSWSSGNHTITVVATDSDGVADSGSYSLNVVH